MAYPDHWEGENVILTFEEEGKDAVYNVEGKISNIGISGGSSSTEETYLFGSKTINIQKPREKFTLTLEGVYDNVNLARIFHGDNTSDQWTFIHTSNIGIGKELRSGGPAVVLRRWRVALWFVEATNLLRTGNSVVPAKTGNLGRIIMADCKAVTFDREFAADDMIKGTLVLEFSATDGDGYANMFEEYTTSQSATALTVLSATAHKGTLTWSTTTKLWTGSYRT